MKIKLLYNSSSYVLSDILGAFLHAQLNEIEKIQKKRQTIWQFYYEHLKDWAIANNVRLPIVPKYCEQAYHMFYL